MSDQKAIVSAVSRDFYDRRHPGYITSLAHWNFCEASYRGGREWFPANVFKYFKEGEVEFSQRLERAYRFNHTREVVDLVQKYLFKAPIVRNVTDVDPDTARFWKKATRAGLNIDQFVRIASTKSSICGRVAVVIDNNMPRNTPLMSEAEVAEGQFLTYGYVVSAPDILDYAWDEDGDGELLWIKLREHVRDDRDPLTSTGLVEERVRLWTRTHWTLYKEVEQAGSSAASTPTEKTIIQLDAGEHGLGFVPVKIFDHILGADSYASQGLIDDIAYLDRAVANYLSNLDAIIQDQTFSQLAIPAQSFSQGDDQFTRVLEMGTKRIFTFDGGAGSTAKPEFLSPDPKQAGVILSVVNKVINEIYHSIGLAGERTKEDNSVGIDNSSGVAKAYDFERVNALLLAKAQSCEHLENWIVKTVRAWAGEKDVAAPIVTYPVTFDVARLGDELATAELLGKIMVPIELRREQMNTVIDKLFPQISKELRTSLRAAVEKWQDAPEAPATPAPSKGQGNTPKPSTVAGSRQGEITSNTK